MTPDSRILCRVVEVAAESDIDAPPEIPLHLLPQRGQVAFQLRTTLPRIAVGAGLARNEELLLKLHERTRLPVVTSSAGGTVVLTGPGVLGFSAIGLPPEDSTFSLDWMLQRLAQWFIAALQTLRVEEISVGCVHGAWCPGFSDLAVGGKKLIGIGFRVTKDWVAARGVVPVLPYAGAEFEALRSAHKLAGMTIEQSAMTSVQECAPAVSGVDDLIARWRGVVS